MIDLTDICEQTLNEMRGIMPMPQDKVAVRPIEILEIYLVGLPDIKYQEHQEYIKLVKAKVYLPEKGGYEERYYLQDPRHPKEYRLRNNEFGARLALCHVLVYSMSGNDTLRIPQEKDMTGRYKTLNARKIRR
jgi:hypothetical protein